MQTVLKGEHSIGQSVTEIKKAGHSKVFLVTGKHFVESIGLDFLNGLEFDLHIKQGPNVEEEEIEAGIREFSTSRAGAILAIGGGSVIDLAKAILFRCIQDSSTLPFFVVAPTTTGSGSEATQFAVVYQGKKKKSLADPGLLPACVILDPVLTYSLSSYQAAVSGMDALSQAVESYWSKGSTPDSRNYAKAAIKIWNEFFPAAVEYDSFARSKMLEAAYNAGQAINITRTTGPHALSYYLTAYHGLSHGHAVALFLPLFFLYNEAGSELCELLHCRDAHSAKNHIQTVMQKQGLATTLDELGIDKNQIMDGLLNEVNEERFANNPAPFDRAKLKELIREYL
ncbi:MAG TPA: phosphonoacetaldehyde reductase [Chitinophagaceae bacterium]|nr:phosphonoacetaldehyde reductase [Chitinophagaceae bacterium]